MSKDFSSDARKVKREKYSMEITKLPSKFVELKARIISFRVLDVEKVVIEGKTATKPQKFSLLLEYEGKKKRVTNLSTHMGEYFTFPVDYPEDSDFKITIITRGGILSSRQIEIGNVVLKDVTNFKLDQLLKLTISGNYELQLSVGVNDPLKSSLKSTIPGKVGCQDFREDVYLSSVERPQISFEHARELNNFEVLNWINKNDKYFEIVNITRHSGYGISGSRDNGRQRTGCYVETTIFFRRNNVPLETNEEEQEMLRMVFSNPQQVKQPQQQRQQQPQQQPVQRQQQMTTEDIKRVDEVY